METSADVKINELIHKGVQILNPKSVEIGAHVKVDNISKDGVIIHTGCKISGRSTLILPGAELGAEGPVSVDNCQIGPDVHLKGGYFKDAVFLSKASAGLGTRVREGTIMEEESSVSHSVDLKQTILFPYVTLGSLINFCDCLIAGGTSRKDHSEVGSSFIHFNYTPNQDKATPSLMGDVARGVMLNQRPIFLGGQGGLVGPCRLEFGTVTAAGTICRKDELRPGRLIYERRGQGGNIPFQAGIYQGIKRIVTNNLIYIANLATLMQWYTHVRSQFVSQKFPDLLLEGVKQKLHMAWVERITRLEDLSQKMPAAVGAYQKAVNESAAASLVKRKNEFFENWPKLKELLNELRRYEGVNSDRDTFLELIHHKIKSEGNDYIAVIKKLNIEDAKSGTLWLQGIVDHITSTTLSVLPSFVDTKG